MVFSYFRWWVVAFVAAGIIFSGSLVSGEECGGDLSGLIAQCQNYVKIKGPKTPPSRECCQAVKAAHFPCVCKYVTPDVEQIISMPKVVYVASYCGRRLASGTKCGSYTVP